jgi:hypothetical protein
MYKVGLKMKELETDTFNVTAEEGASLILAAVRFLPT